MSDAVFYGIDTLGGLRHGHIIGTLCAREVAMTRTIAILAVVLSSGWAVSTQAQQVLHAPDGGTRETLTSIVVPPLPNAPFSATVETEWTKYFADGSTQVTRNHRLIARDGLGRVFQERRTFVPKGSPIESQVWRTDLAEPSTHTVAYCDTRTHICELRPYVAAASTTTSGGPLAAARGLVNESLGAQTLNGLELIGTRETQTINPLVTGSDRPLLVVKEFWYSKQLSLNVLTTRNDPRSGKEVFTVTGIRLGEPDPALFALPPDARVVDLRAALAR
jgi:hypothetical protein